jgi:hypothetical protein
MTQQKAKTRTLAMIPLVRSNMTTTFNVKKKTIDSSTTINAKNDYNTSSIWDKFAITQAMKKDEAITNNQK